MASSVSLFGTPAADSSNPAKKDSTNIASAGVFLQLLVSQLKNQDPLNPSDSTQFVTQLAQFSQLENIIGIRNNTDTIAKNSTAETEAADAAAAEAAAAAKALNGDGTNKTSN